MTFDKRDLRSLYKDLDFYKMKTRQAERSIEWVYATEYMKTLNVGDSFTIRFRGKEQTFTVIGKNRCIQFECDGKKCYASPHSIVVPADFKRNLRYSII